MKLYVLRSPSGIGSMLDSMLVIAKSSTAARRLAAKDDVDNSWLDSKLSSCNVVSMKKAKVLKRVFMRA
jgi:hypothetical protein